MPTSAFHRLIFVPSPSGDAWTATSGLLTFTIERTEMGYRAHLQKWSNDQRAFVTEPVPFNHSNVVFSQVLEAQGACQTRYEQELRWSANRTHDTDRASQP